MVEKHQIHVIVFWEYDKVRAMYVNGMREMLHESGSEGITVDDLKLCILLYADDSVLIAESRLDSAHDHCGNYVLIYSKLK